MIWYLFQARYSNKDVLLHKIYFFQVYRIIPKQVALLCKNIILKWLLYFFPLLLRIYRLWIKKGHSTLPHGSGDQLIYHLERLIHLTQHLNTTSATHVTGNNQEPMIPPELWPKNCHGDRIDIKLNKGPTYEAVIVLVRSLWATGTSERARKAARESALDPLTSSDSLTAQCSRVRIPQLQTARKGRALQGATQAQSKVG